MHGLVGSHSVTQIDIAKDCFWPIVDVGSVYETVAARASMRFLTRSKLAEKICKVP